MAQKLTGEQSKFKEAWMYHVRQLQALSLQADVGYEKWMSLKTELEAWIMATPTMQGEENDVAGRRISP